MRGGNVTGRRAGARRDRTRCAQAEFSAPMNEAPERFAQPAEQERPKSQGKPADPAPSLLFDAKRLVFIDETWAN